MCNRYRTDKANAALFEAFQDWKEIGDRERWDQHGRNMPVPFETFPNMPGRIVHLDSEGNLVLSEALWGLPSNPDNLIDKRTGLPLKRDPGVTNIRHPWIDHWKPYLGVPYRCLVPWTSFCEQDQASGSKADVWFDFADGRDLGFFAGVYADVSRQIRKMDAGPTTGLFFAFLTTSPNAEVKAVHPKAMPVILTSREDMEKWLKAPWEDAKTLQRKLGDGVLRTIARGPAVDPDKEPDLFG